MSDTGAAQAALASRLGHDFARPALLTEALTHPSLGGPDHADNQRLEFLGDRILGLAIAEALLESRPRGARGRSCAALQRARPARDLRRGRRRNRAGRGAAAWPVREALGRSAQGGALGRRHGSGDRGGPSRRRVRRRAGADPAALGRPDRNRQKPMPATRKARCRNGRRRAGRHRHRNMTRSAAMARPMRTALHRRRAAVERRRGAARRPARNGPPNRRLRQRCWQSSGCDRPVIRQRPVCRRWPRRAGWRAGQKRRRTPTSR
jgi:hypothetical protein